MDGQAKKPNNGQRKNPERLEKAQMLPSPAAYTFLFYVCLCVVSLPVLSGIQSVADTCRNQGCCGADAERGALSAGREVTSGGL